MSEGPVSGPPAPAGPAGPAGPARPVGPASPADTAAPAGPADIAHAAAAAGDAAAPPDPRVAEVLQQLRSGVRQRQAEAATVGGGLAAPGGAGGFAQALLAVKAAEYLQEPVSFSHRPRLGKLIVGSRKAFFHLFLKWFLRPVLAQQNAFNQAAGRMLQELAEAQERTARETRLLGARLTELEARAEAAAAAASAAAAAGDASRR